MEVDLIMSGKPRKTKTVGVDWKTYQQIESEAIEKDQTIKDTIEGYIKNSGKEIKQKKEQITELRNELRDCLEEREELSLKVKDLKVELEKERSKSKETEWEEVNYEDLKDELAGRTIGKNQLIDKLKREENLRIGVK